MENLRFTVIEPPTSGELEQQLYQPNFRGIINFTAKPIDDPDAEPRHFSIRINQRITNPQGNIEYTQMGENIIRVYLDKNMNNPATGEVSQA